MTGSQSQDQTQSLCEQVRQAASDRVPVCIEGHHSKAFYGRIVSGQTINTGDHRGILSHQPSELTIQARSGTPLAEIEAALLQHQQVLAFEPPCFSGGGTLGGAIATGLSGPARPFRGAARDFVLGVSLINGQGQLLRFGGQVMKNVAGYDVSRFVTASMGTLGLFTDVSLKVLPAPQAELTLVQDADENQAIERFTGWSRKGLPLSAACWYNNQIFIRFSGVEAELDQMVRELGGEPQKDPESWWSSVRNHGHDFFHRPGVLWRLSVPPATPPLSISGDWFLDWGGAQRWLRSSEDSAAIRSLAEDAGGHAMIFRGGDRSGEIFHPLPGPLFKLHQKLKKAMDPNGILNPGRMYEGL